MTMNLDELRDAFMSRQGWHYEPPQVDGLGEQREYWWKWTISSAHGGRTYSYTHPVPATLDAIAGLMPPGWDWERTRTLMGMKSCWKATHPQYHHYLREHLRVNVLDTGDELLDRARLAWLAWEAEAKGAAQ